MEKLKKLTVKNYKDMYEELQFKHEKLKNDYERKNFILRNTEEGLDNFRKALTEKDKELIKVSAQLTVYKRFYDDFVARVQVNDKG